MQLQNTTKDQLRAIVARIERLEEEKAALAADLREVYAEAKGNGFDVKALRAVIRIRKQDENKRREEEAVLDTYLHALGMARPRPPEAALNGCHAGLSRHPSRDIGRMAGSSPGMTTGFGL